MEESFHVSATFSHGRVVFIENLAVLEDQANIILELILSFVTEKNNKCT